MYIHALLSVRNDPLLAFKENTVNLLLFFVSSSLYISIKAALLLSSLTDTESLVQVLSHKVFTIVILCQRDIFINPCKTSGYTEMLLFEIRLAKD